MPVKTPPSTVKSCRCWKSATIPASRIAYNIDAELAQELTLGLLRSPAIISAQMTDNNGNVLANVKRPELQSGYRVISDFLFGAKRQFEDRLYLDHLPNESLGTLSLEVDTYAFGSRFLRRAEVTLLNGFARSLILTGILLALFYVMLTKPLVRLIRELSARDARSAEPTTLECPAGHANDEIGVLVKVANQQFDNIATEIQQRRNAENRLTDYLGQLEHIVSRPHRRAQGHQHPAQPVQRGTGGGPQHRAGHGRSALGIPCQHEP